MGRDVRARIAEHFQELTDPRRREATYPLINIVVMALCAVLSGADDFVSIAHWAEMKQDWLSKFLDMSAGVPSHDRFNAVLGGAEAGGVREVLAQLDHGGSQDYRRPGDRHRRQDAAAEF